ncbi:uncharacterized protein ISCGN_001902 [Ixodes scapularis]
MGTQTSPDDLHLPSRSPSKPPRTAPVAPPPNRKVNAALPASTPEPPQGAPVKAGVWRVASPRTPSPAGGACTLGARCLVSSVTTDPSHVGHHTRTQGAPTLRGSFAEAVSSRGPAPSKVSVATQVSLGNPGKPLLSSMPRLKLSLSGHSLSAAKAAEAPGHSKGSGAIEAMEVTPLPTPRRSSLEESERAPRSSQKRTSSPKKPPASGGSTPAASRSQNWQAMPVRGLRTSSEQEMTSPAQPAASTSRGRGLPPHTSAPQRKPGEVPRQSTSKGQLPAAADEPMDDGGSRSDEEALLSRSESMSGKVCTSTRNAGNMRKAECDSMFRKITAASIGLLLTTPEEESFHGPQASRRQFVLVQSVQNRTDVTTTTEFGKLCNKSEQCSSLGPEFWCHPDYHNCTCRGGLLWIVNLHRCAEAVSLKEECEASEQCIAYDRHSYCGEFGRSQLPPKICQCQFGFNMKSHDKQTRCIEIPNAFGTPLFDSRDTVPIVMGCLAAGLALVACCAGIVQLLRIKQRSGPFRTGEPQDPRESVMLNLNQMLQPYSDIIPFRVPPCNGAGGSSRCSCRGAGALQSAAKISRETWVALDSERGAGPLRTTSAKLPFDKKENRFLASGSVRPPRKQGKHKAASAASSAASAKSRRISTGGGVSSSGIVSSEDVQASSSTEVHDGAAAPAPSTFDLLFENANSVTLPEASWAVHRVDMEGVRDVVYSKIVVSQGSPVSTLCISKAVHIKSDASVNVLLLGKLLDCVTEAECKRRWRLIRDRYAKESKGAKGKSGAGREDVTQPTWVLYKFLEFLDVQIHRRKSMVRAPASRAMNTGQTNEPSPGEGSTAQEILMGVYNRKGTPAAEGQPGTPEAGTEDDCDDLEPSATCSLLMHLEERGETPNVAQLTPPLEGPAASHEDLLPQAGRSSQANGAAPAATKRPASPEGPRPPAPKRRARSSAQHIRTREESELLRVLGQTSSAMANSCTRPHMDSSNPAIMAFALIG